MADGIVREKLNFYYLLCTSNSMNGARIEQLNLCMQELQPALEEAGIDNNVDIIVRVIEFGNDNISRWYMGTPENGIPIKNFIWENLCANGLCRPTSLAIEMVADSLSSKYLGTRALRPVIVLITDGSCTDGGNKYNEACELLANKIGGKATRIAVGVENFNRAELEKFASRGDIGEEKDKPFVFEAKNAETMTEIIRWASVVSITSSLQNNSNNGKNKELNNYYKKQTEVLKMSDGMVREKLNIYYLLDTSGSMNGARIEQLNTCMQELQPALEEAGIDNNVDIIVRAIEFGNNSKAKWHEGDKTKGTPIDKFIWVDLKANGDCTPTSAAITMAAESLDPEYLGSRALRPVIILITDGGCTDVGNKYNEACDLLANKIGGKATRIAVGVENFNRAELERFASRGDIGEDKDKPFVFEAKNAETMTEIIRWASVVSIISSSKLSSGNDETIVLPDEEIETDWI